MEATEPTVHEIRTGDLQRAGASQNSLGLTTNQPSAGISRNVRLIH